MHFEMNMVHFYTCIYVHVHIDRGKQVFVMLIQIDQVLTLVLCRTPLCLYGQCPELLIFFLPVLYWLVNVLNIPLALGIQEVHSMNSCGFFFSLITERITTAKKKKNELEREIPWNCQSPVKEKLTQILELLATLLIILRKSLYSVLAFFFWKRKYTEPYNIRMEKDHIVHQVKLSF